MKKIIFALIALGFLAWLCSISIEQAWKEEKAKEDKEFKEALDKWKEHADKAAAEHQKIIQQRRKAWQEWERKQKEECEKLGIKYHKTRDFWDEPNPPKEKE